MIDYENFRTQWEWLRKSQGLLYNGMSDYRKASLANAEYLKKGLMEIYLEHKYGIKINNLN